MTRPVLCACVLTCSSGGQRLNRGGGPSTDHQQHCQGGWSCDWQTDTEATPTHPPPGGQAPVPTHTWVLWVTLGADAVRGHSLKHCSTWQAKGPGQAEGSLVVAGIDQRWQRLRGIVWQACAATVRGRVHALESGGGLVLRGG